MKELCEYFRVNIDIKINMIVMRENDLKKELYIEIPFWYSPYIFCDYIVFFYPFVIVIIIPSQRPVPEYR